MFSSLPADKLSVDAPVLCDLFELVVIVAEE